MRCFYFGCWNTAGHYLVHPGGSSVRNWSESQAISYYSGKDGERFHLDGTLAPRKHGRTGELFWVSRNGERVRHEGQEYPQGQFLLHHLPNGFTAIQWWDRCQGDTRGACNSTILLEGEHDTAAMLAALLEHFPHVLENLGKAGVELVEVERP